MPTSGTLATKKSATAPARSGPLAFIAAHKIVAAVIAVVVLAAIGVTIFLVSGGKDNQPPHTPNLKMQFWQRSVVDKAKTSGNHTTVKMQAAPFSIKFPVVPIDRGPRICAWTDNSIFTLKAGTTMDQYPCFKPGSVLQTPGFGASDLTLAKDGHNNIVGDQLVEVEDGWDQVSFSSITPKGQDDPIGFHTDIYLAIFLDKNGNSKIDKGEYDFVILDF